MTYFGPIPSTALALTFATATNPRPPPPPPPPQVNPDGWAWNEAVRPRGGGMKRKNGLRSCGRGVRPGPSDGVDLNRNFGFKWGYTKQQGSSAQGCAEEYRGAAPFSEPETRAVRDVIARHSVAAVLHWHGCGATAAPHPNPHPAPDPNPGPKPHLHPHPNQVGQQRGLPLQL